ncbi:MAG TPA: class I SAM-dependent methyltransferase [Terriglobia bacterium]|nr:class I SAM-dependent methyltransferase [Terriglobia bacterium]
METLAHVRRFGPLWLKKLIWNLDFRRTKWEKGSPAQKLIELLLQTLQPESRVLDLGCANGALLACLRAGGWKGHYTGVDVSSEALKRAAARGIPECEWKVCDIADYTTLSRYDVIVASNSLYYLCLDEATRLLERLPGYLTPNGTIIIRIHDKEQYRNYTEVIEKIYPTAQKLAFGNGPVYYIYRKKSIDPPKTIECKVQNDVA